MEEKEKDKIKQDMQKILKRHGKTLKKLIDEVGEEEFWKQVDEAANKDKIEN